jgi:glyoxylase-like metal-dependent hydrolase (beta-lactamase superfamily II)
MLMLQIGDIRIHLINDGDTLVDPGGAFGLVPRALWSRHMDATDDHLVPMKEICLLAQVGDENIVIDTGMGNKMDEKTKAIWRLSRPTRDLVAALGRVGLKREDITLVINTHLHVDHCSGNTQYNAEGGVEATFPNATHVVQRREYEDASRPNERTAGTYYDINWKVLEENGQLRLFDGDIQLSPGVWGVVTPGHTPGHMSVRFESGGQHAAYLCDMASYAVHFERLGWMTAYDVEPLVTLETKRWWQRWALETNAAVIFAHEPYRPAGRLKLNEKGNPQVVGIDEPFV